MSSRKLAIVTGASSGIGLELAKCAAQDGYDLIVAADTPFVEAGPALKEYGVQVEELEADLATRQGVDQLLAKVAGPASRQRATRPRAASPMRPQALPRRAKCSTAHRSVIRVPTGCKAFQLFRILNG